MEFLKQHKLYDGILDAIDAKYLASAFPHATTKQIDDLLALITSVPKSGKDAVPALLEVLLDTLVQLEQIEILHEELPKVLADEEYEQQVWKDASNKTEIKRLAARENAELLIRQKEEPKDSQMPPEGTIIGRYFDSRYTIGEQSELTDIDAMARMDILFTALRDTREALVNSFPPKPREAMVGTRVYKFLSMMLNVIGRYFRIAATDKRSLLVIITMLLTLSGARTCRRHFLVDAARGRGGGIRCTDVPSAVRHPSRAVLVLRQGASAAEVGGRFHGGSARRRVRRVVALAATPRD